MYINIETERLTIRPINLKDAEFIIDLVNSDGWLKFIGDRNISDISDARNYIQKILDNPNFYYSVFELKESRKAIGVVTFLKREDEKYPDIGFALLPEFEKNGYVFEASKSYLEKIKSLDKYVNIIAITLPDNQKSINLLQKLGLQYIGDYEKEKVTISYYVLKNEK
ncbi:GNAT family N-acetyltransferase [Marivirga sp.]|uniref:GNAT family N-acetyltransferase n=1 Tax=Marivirga sp. TaxID=2018662 RepID=UPI002D8052E3|nr:GNAT family N-acetyltransferase [Marivirga sp.]HET8859360.1 GNAT family N-acetyltransferase [Marivirga sp.]